MARPSPYPPELRKRAVRRVAEVRPDYATEWAAMKAVASKLGIGSTETLRSWFRQDQIDGGTRPGTTTEESAQVKALKKENAELKRANETGAVRGRKVITTIADPAVVRAPDRLGRDFVADAPNRTWVADFTHVAAWAGTVYVAFVVEPSPAASSAGPPQ